MRICAATIWYDEHPDDLAETVSSLAGFADCMVALDGPFRTFPAENPYSATEQVGAIAQACSESGIELLTYQPAEPGRWLSYAGDEVEKRNAALDFAGTLGADWVQAVDADMTLLPGWETARARLEETDLVVAETMTGSPLRNCFRWTPTLRYVFSHFALTDGETLVAWPRVFEAGNSGESVTRPQKEGKLADALDLTDCVKFENRRRRNLDRTRRQQDWYAVRDSLRLEEIVG